MVNNAQLEAEQIRNEAREAAQRMLLDARGQLTGNDDRPVSSFSKMWDQAEQSADNAEEFFAGMEGREASDVFNR